MICPMAGFFGGSGFAGAGSGSNTVCTGAAGSAGFSCFSAFSPLFSAGSASFTGSSAGLAGSGASAGFFFSCIASSIIRFSSSSSMVNALVWADCAFSCSCCFLRSASSSFWRLNSWSICRSAANRASASLRIPVAFSRIPEASSTRPLVASFKFTFAIRSFSPCRFRLQSVYLSAALLQAADHLF